MGVAEVCGEGAPMRGGLLGVCLLEGTAMPCQDLTPAASVSSQLEISVCPHVLGSCGIPI